MLSFTKMGIVYYKLVKVYYLSKFSDINFKWTKGHAYNQGNNQADYLVNQAMDQYLAETYNSWY